MQLEITNRTAYNGLVTLDFSRTIDNTKYFLRKQLHYQKFDSSVYLVYDERGRLVYVGKGKFDWLHIDKCRAVKHQKDNLCKHMKKGWKIVFIAIGVTDSEARALEALLISTYAELQGLSKKGSCDWDGVSLINKRRERTWEQRINEFLIYGNNTRIAA